MSAAPHPGTPVPTNPPWSCPGPPCSPGRNHGDIGVPRGGLAAGHRRARGVRGQRPLRRGGLGWTWGLQGHRGVSKLGHGVTPSMGSGGGNRPPAPHAGAAAACYLGAQQHRVRRQRACGGGWPVRGGGLGRERERERDSETARGQVGEHGKPTSWLGRKGSGDTRVHTSPQELERSQTCSRGGLRWADEGHPLPPRPDVTLGTGSGGRGREGGSGRAEPRTAGCGERERGDKPCSMRRPPSRQAETERSPPSVRSSGGPALAGMGTNPNGQRSSQVAVPGCQGVGSHT